MSCAEDAADRRGRVDLLCAVGIVVLVSVCLLVSGSDAVVAEERPTLYWGSRGQTVRQVQSRLAQWDYYHGPIDGIFGQQTSEAVRLFQRRNNLTVDGVVGPETYAALGMAADASPPGEPTTGVLRDDELELLARVITGEARGEPYVGQVAVAAVVLNRVRNSSFPGSVSAVVYQPLAFEAVSDGQIWMQPTSTAFRAARDALNGWDPTYGSVYYWNPYKPVNPWVWTRSIVTQIGRHVFAK